MGPAMKTDPEGFSPKDSFACGPPNRGWAGQAHAHPPPAARIAARCKRAGGPDHTTLLLPASYLDGSSLLSSELRDDAECQRFLFLFDLVERETGFGKRRRHVYLAASVVSYQKYVANDVPGRVVHDNRSFETATQFHF